MVTSENFISSRMDRSPPSNGLFFFFGQKLSRRKKKTNLPKLSFFSSSPFFPVALSFPAFVSVIFELLRRKNLPCDPFPLNWQNISLGQKIGLIYRRKNYSKSGIYVYNSLVFESEKQREKSNIKLGNEPLYHELRLEKSGLIQTLNKRSSVLGSTTQTKALRKDLVPKYLLL